MQPRKEGPAKEARTAGLLDVVHRAQSATQRQLAAPPKDAWTSHSNNAANTTIYSLRHDSSLACRDVCCSWNDRCSLSLSRLPSMSLTLRRDALNSRQHDLK